MRILLDECVPRRFRLQLPEHEVRTAPEMGWASFKNGKLLAAASGKFDILLTADQRLRCQHDISSYPFALVVLIAKRNKLEQLLPHVAELKRVLAEVMPGEVREVGGE